MRDHKKISEALDKLLNSKTFAKSGTNKDLLNYLVNCSLKGETPKEYQIAFDVFGKKADQEKDFNVRVYIFNLRNKLKEYYKQEGKEDSIRIEIPKGKYVVEFKFLRAKEVQKKIYSLSPALFIFSILILVLSIFMLVFRNSPRSPKSALWNGFPDNKYPVLLVLGDHYFFRGPIATGKIGTCRDNHINSSEDFDRLLIDHPELIGTIDESSVTYINNQAPIGLFRVMNMFKGSIQDIDMKYSSQLRWEDTQKHHLIFIGSIKTLRFLKKTIEKTGLIYHLDHTTYEYQTKDTTINFNNHSDGYLQYEYAPLIHFQTSDGRKVMFLLCDSDVGNIASVKFLTDPNSIPELEEKMKQIGTQNFKAIFEVKGQQQTDFEIKLVRIDPIDQPISEIWP